MADIKAYRGYNSSFYGYFTLSMTGGIYLVGHFRYDFPIPSAPHPIQKPPRAPKHLRSEDSTPPATWMSREVSKWVITWYNLPTNGVYWGYNPLANLLQTRPKSSYKWEVRCFHPSWPNFYGHLQGPQDTPFITWLGPHLVGGTTIWNLGLVLTTVSTSKA